MVEGLSRGIMGHVIPALEEDRRIAIGGLNSILLLSCCALGVPMDRLVISITVHILYFTVRTTTIVSRTNTRVMLHDVLSSQINHFP